ncbi:MAG: hypothetical protein IPK15_02585 [Verrucomicrobia bacterium]|nr:hypothetical protein [Verrucomicrobiota bacterium]
MKKIILIVAGVVVVLVVALVVVLTLSLDSLVKKGVETVGPQITKTEMKLEKASISILSGSGALHGFHIGNPEGYKTPTAIKFGEASVGVKPGSVLSDKIHVTHVKVVGPEITFEGALGSKNNLSKIMENVEEATGGSAPADKSSPPADSGASKKLQVDDFLISGAKVNVTLTALGGRQLTVAIPDIHMTNLGSGPEGITAGELTKLVLKNINKETFEAIQKSVADVGKQAADALKDMSKGGTNSLNKAAETLKGVGDLFKKK